MRIVLLLALLLAGCIADQKRDVASCTLDARNAHPEIDRAREFTPEMARAMDTVQNAIELCMATKDYEFVYDPKIACGPNLPSSENAACYRPTGYIERLLYRLEITLNN